MLDMECRNGCFVRFLAVAGFEASKTALPVNASQRELCPYKVLLTQVIQPVRQ
jgi:hypothetical protein